MDFVIVILVILFLLTVVLLIGSLVLLMRIAIRMIGSKKDTNRLFLKLRKRMIITFSTISVMILFIFVSQQLASTPQIKDEQGNIISGSIAELRKIKLNGRTQWISIRGENRSNPILLFLAGGPGGTQMASVRHNLAALEKEFIVVNWDQPGSGKSYSSIPINKITVETYIDDGVALTKYLCNEFNQQKVYLVGESWGSALGIFMVDREPDIYGAFIGTGQMVNFEQTEIIDYKKAIELARQENDTKTVAKLIENGEPPYYGDNVTMKSAVYLNFLTTQMNSNPEIYNGGYNTFRDLSSSEYGALDKMNFFRGLLNTFNHVYPQLYGIDLAKDYCHIDVPVYFFIGEHDINAPISLLKSYYEVLDAKKSIVWFKHSGHNPWINESDKFVKELIKIKQNN